MLNTPAGKVAGVVGVVALIGLMVFSYRSTFSQDLVPVPDDFTYICSETNKTFKVNRSQGMEFPVKSPHTGKMTGYPATACYWTKDGKIRQEHYWVLLNRTVGRNEPTYCPDCDRLVEAQAGEPYPGVEPPPKRPHGQVQNVER